MAATATAIGEWVAGSEVATAAAAGAGGALATAALTSKPGMPDVKAPTAMPDPLEQQKAREKSIIEQLARRGRSAAILTNESGSATLGGG